MSVHVVCGANQGSFPLQGMTVSQVAQGLRDVLSTYGRHKVWANGEVVSGDHVLGDGDHLEFGRTFGHKGGIHDFSCDGNFVERFGSDKLISSNHTKVLISKSIGFGPRTAGLVIDSERCEVSCQGQGPCDLGPTILFRLIERLARRTGIWISFDRLKDDVWQDEFTCDETIGRTVRRLREKLKAAGITGIDLKVKKHKVMLTLH